jgi:uncharacterized alkaline shock family protein YloU
VASYAADAARGVEGVSALVESRLPRHRSVHVNGERVELHLQLSPAATAGEICREVQRRVAGYLERITGGRPHAVDIVVDRVAPRA